MASSLPDISTDDSHQVSAPPRPLTLLIAALGGEGGGVLTDWIIRTAQSLDFPVQSTSIPGVAQRTGATTYYLELYPVAWGQQGGALPVMPLAPVPGCVDVMLASELLEAGRALLGGFVTPGRTTLIASTHRVLTVAEKMQMGDGRVDSERLLEAARALSKHALLFDMQALAQRSGTVINAVLFGALAGSGTLPLPRGACEAAIRGAGRGAEASLKGFALGFDQARGALAADSHDEASALDRSHTPAAQALSEKLLHGFPATVTDRVAKGIARQLDFQDARYAQLYVERLRPLLSHAGTGPGAELLRETARFLALWMSYEDVIRVADLKTRRSRLERVRNEVRAGVHEPVRIVDYFKPRLEELGGVLPGPLARGLLGWAHRRGLAEKLSVGLHIPVTGVAGFLMLRSLAVLRPLRRITSRYAEEQALIERWLRAIEQAAAGDLEVAQQIALCGRLIKGYSDTHQRGRSNFLRIMETLVEPAECLDRAAAIREAREAALADPDGGTLETRLAARGVASSGPRPKPLKFFRRPTEQQKAA